MIKFKRELIIEKISIDHELLAIYIKTFRNYHDVINVGNIKYFGNYISFSVERNPNNEHAFPTICFNNICNIKGYNKFKRLNKYTR